MYSHSKSKTTDGGVVAAAAGTYTSAVFHEEPDERESEPSAASGHQRHRLPEQFFRHD